MQQVKGRNVWETRKQTTIKQGGLHSGKVTVRTDRRARTSNPKPRLRGQRQFPGTHTDREVLPQASRRRNLGAGMPSAFLSPRDPGTPSLGYTATPQIPNTCIPHAHARGQSTAPETNDSRALLYLHHCRRGSASSSSSQLTRRRIRRHYSTAPSGDWSPSAEVTPPAHAYWPPAARIEAGGGV